MISFLKGLVVNSITLVITFALYIGLTQALVLIYSNVYLGYDVVNGANDAEALITIFLLWNTLFGPYAVMLRKVAKYLPKKSTDDYV